MAKKVKNSYTEIVMVVDRSGSMSSCRVESENGLNHFVEEQKKESGQKARLGKCLYTLVQFDTEYEFVHKGEHILNVGKFTLVPRGMTALLDAVGRAINETAERINNMKKKDKPNLVIVVIITDGGENSSHEFKIEQIKKLIEEKQSDTGGAWQFTFLGANQDSFQTGGWMGINPSGIANYDVKSSVATFSNICSNVSRMRCASMDGSEVKSMYTDKERKAME